LNPDSSVEFDHLESYALLLRQLMPRTDCIALFDALSQLRWGSEGTIGQDLQQIVERSSKEMQTDGAVPGTLVASEAQSPAYLFWLHDGAGEFLGTVAVTTRAAGDGSHQPFGLVHSLLRPVLEILRRDLATGGDLRNLRRSLATRDRDVELLLSVSDPASSEDRDQQDELKNLLHSAADHLKCTLTTLIVPDKGITLLSAGHERTPDGALLARIHRQLLQLVQVKRKTMVINKPSGRNEDGKVSGLPYRFLLVPMRQRSDRVTGVLGLLRLDTEEKFVDRDVRIAELLARRAGTIIDASYDSLSGLLTRPALERRVRSATAGGMRPGAWSVLYIDSDQLHVVNESFGMHAGDKAISQIGELIRRRLPPGALAARISGDRFAVVVPLNVESASDFAEQLRVAAEQVGPAVADGAHVGVTIGVAGVNGDRDDLVHALAEAESACRAGKDRGRNRVATYQDADASIIQRFADITTSAQLRHAIDTNRFRLDSQMMLPLSQSGGGIPHFEILLRMIDLVGETVGPERFLSAARRYQLMPQIDRWVIDRALAMLKPHADLLAQRPVVFSINFSGQSLGDEGFADYLLDRIKTSGLDAGIFCFELTESEAVANIAKAEVLLNRLRKLGCAVALDDFGTGLSSLSYLRSLPVTMLKIDGSFVREILRDPRSDSMVQAIAQLAATMSIETVAEYVETEELITRVAALGIDYAQGFAVAKPVPLEETLLELPLYAGARPVTLPIGSDSDGLVVGIG
jgi:diguanylate cyclase (GGDEF)-like protein